MRQPSERLQDMNKAIRNHNESVNLTLLPLSQVILAIDWEALSIEKWSNVVEIIEKQDRPFVQAPPSNFVLPNCSLSSLGLSARAFNCLARAGVNDLKTLLAHSLSEIISIRNLGQKSLSEIFERLHTHLERESRQIVETENMSVVAADDAEDEEEAEVTTFLSVLALGLVADDTEDEEEAWDLLDWPDGLTDYVPNPVSRKLLEKGIRDPIELLNTPIFQLLRADIPKEFAEEDWTKLIQFAKAVHTSRNCRPKTTNGRPGLSIRDLGLSTRSFNCLVRQGIGDLRTLLNCTLSDILSLRNIGRKSIHEILFRLSENVEIASILAKSASNVPKETESPPIQEPEEISFCENEDLLMPSYQAREISPILSPSERLNVWLQCLTERQQNVIFWRYALLGDRPLTLEEIAQKLKITRERVRQIEAKAINRLLASKKRHLIVPIIEQLSQILADKGGVATEEEVVAELSENTEIEGIGLLGLVSLLMNTNSNFAKVRRTRAWGLSDLPLELISEINRQIAKILASEHAPLPKIELLNRFKSMAWYEERAKQLSDDFLIACLTIHEKIVCREDGCYGLEKWERQYQDDIIMALRRLGKPTHYKEIAEAVNTALPPNQTLTCRAIHIRLMRYPELFVWVGQRGTYGLAEWGLERPVSYEDALTQIFEARAHPLKLYEILAELKTIRPYYDESSVILTLGTNNRFRAFPNKNYGLSKWREDDFTSDIFRLAQLFEVSETTGNPKPGLNVARQIEKVDDFLSGVREKNEHAFWWKHDPKES